MIESTNVHDEQARGVSDHQVAEGWWLASDGKWYAPHLVSASVTGPTAAPTDRPAAASAEPSFDTTTNSEAAGPDVAPAEAPKTPNRSVVIVGALIAVFLIGFGSLFALTSVTGTNPLASSGPKAQKWSIGTKVQLATGCEMQGPDGGGGNASVTSSSCKCWVDAMAKGGLKESVVQDVIAGNEPYSKIEGPASKAATKCGLSDQ